MVMSADHEVDTVLGMSIRIRHRPKLVAEINVLDVSIRSITRVAPADSAFHP